MPIKNVTWLLHETAENYFFPSAELKSKETFSIINPEWNDLSNDGDFSGMDDPGGAPSLRSEWQKSEWFIITCKFD